MLLFGCHYEERKMRKRPSDIEQRKLLLSLLEEMPEPNRPEVEEWMDRYAQNFDAEEAWKKFSGRIGEERGGLRGGGRVWVLRGLGAAAAVLMLGLFTVVIARYLKDLSDSKPVIMAATTIVKQDTLSDGSTIVLNTNSTLTYPKNFAESNRLVELVGEAFFDVRSDSAKPFIIQAGTARIRVLGTSFHVRAYPGTDLKVYVESGRVELIYADSASHETTQRVLLPGEKGRINHATHTLTLSAEIDPDELFWVNRKLIFRQTNLEVVFDLLKTHYNARIIVKNEQILSCLLSATFNNEAIGQILEVIAASFELDIDKIGETFIITGNGCHHEE